MARCPVPEELNIRPVVLRSTPENLPIIPTALKEDRFKCTEEYCSVWRVNDFMNRERLTSPDFIILHMKFNFILERNHYNKPSREYFEVFLKCDLLNELRKWKTITVTTYLADHYNNRTPIEIVIKSTTETSLYFRIWHAKIKDVFKEFRRSGEEDSIVEVVSRIQPTMGPRKDIRDQLLIKRYEDPYVFLHILSEDCLNLLNSGYMSDVTLKCSEEEVRAHKIILSIRSKKFAENILNNEESFNIDDMDMFTLKKILYYIYSGKIPEPEDRVEDLYKAAFTYGIEGLHIGLASYMIVTFKPNELLEQIEVAEELSDLWFKERAYSYLEKTGYLKKRDVLHLMRKTRKMTDDREN